jgi:hypothetical protein
MANGEQQQETADDPEGNLCWGTIAPLLRSAAELTDAFWIKSWIMGAIATTSGRSIPELTSHSAGYVK